MTNETPMYINVTEAVRISGISKRLWYEWLSSDCPPPHIKVGGKHLIQRDGIAPYLEAKQEVRV